MHFALIGWTILEMFDGVIEVFYRPFCLTLLPIVERGVLESQAVSVCLSIFPFSSISFGLTCIIAPLFCTYKLQLCLLGRLIFPSLCYIFFVSGNFLALVSTELQ